MKILIYLIIFLSSLNFSSIFAKDIPVIVISPGKIFQSKNIVGSDVEVIDNKTISN